MAFSFAKPISINFLTSSSGKPSIKVPPDLGRVFWSSGEGLLFEEPKPRIISPSGKKSTVKFDAVKIN